MKKILFTLVCLVGFSCLGFGQWEKISNLPDADSKSVYRSNSNSFLKSEKVNVIGIIGNSLVASNDNGKTWGNRNIPNNYSVDNCILTPKGIYLFNLIDDKGKNAFVFSPDFGRTWQKQNIKDSFYLSGQSKFYSDSIYVYSIFKEKTYFYYNNNSYYSHKRIFKSKLGENAWIEDSTETFRRVDTFYNIYNRDSIPTRRDTNITYKLNSFFEGIDGKRIVYRTPIDSVIIINRQDPRETRRLKSISSGEQTYFNDSLLVITSNNSSETFVTTEASPWNFIYLKGNLQILLSQNELYAYGYKTIQISKDKGKTFTSLLDSTDKGEKFLNTDIYSLSDQDSYIYVLLNNGFIYKIKKGEKNWSFCYSNKTTTSILNTLRSDIKKMTNGTWITKIENRLANSASEYILMFSQDSGKLWQPFDIAPVIRKDDFGYVVNKNDVYICYFSNSVEDSYKTSDLGKTWKTLTTFPKFSSGFSIQDTIVTIGLGGIISAVSPYTNWRSSSFYFDRIIAYENGILYSNTYGNAPKLYRFRLNGSQLTPIDLPLSSSNIYVSNGRIFIYDNDTKTVVRSIDNGATWKTIFEFKSNFPNSFYGVNYLFYVLSNGLLMTSNDADGSCCKNYGKFGGIYVSSDNGDSWVQANENLFAYPNSKYGSNDKSLNAAKLTEFEQYVYFDYWKRKIDDFKFKSAAGNVYVDKNNNGQKDAGELNLNNAPIVSKNGISYTLSDSLGLYTLFINTGGDTLTVAYDNKYAKVTPPFRIIKPTDSTTINQNFGIYLAPNINDLKVNATAITPPRAGFNNSYQITYKNVGSTPANDKVNFTYNAKQSFVEATTAPTSNTNQTLVWNYTNLQPNETRVINLTLKTAADAPIRTAITHVATIDPLSIDTFKTDNVDSLVLTVVGSYDPNDKQVTFNNSKSAPAVIDNTTELTYTIRFQNTGNYPADFVKVTDTLSDKLDISTLRIIATSHKYDVSLKNKNVLTFDFNPIFLPDSTSNEKDSHGFIKFAIKPKKTLTKEEVIKNTGYIFFDYNPAIITNTVETANQKANSLFTPSVSEPIVIYPNPTTGFLTFKMDKNIGKEIAVSIYSIDGKLMINKHQTAQSENIINGETLHEGLYFLQIKVGEEVKIGKFLVQK